MRTIQVKLDRLAKSVNPAGVEFRFMFRKELDLSDKLRSVAVYSQQYTDFISGDRYVLCIVVDDRCVSSIEMYIDEKALKKREIRIDSRTDPRYEGRGLNSLARCLSLIAFSLIKNMGAIISEPVNAISAYNLGKVFDVSIWSDNTLKRLRNSVPTTVASWQSLMDALKGEGDHIFVRVDLTRKNIQRAERYISEWQYRPA